MIERVIKIYVLTNGWVLVGEIYSCDKESIEIINASVITRWGTTKGIGEIALNGPTEKTILNSIGNAKIHVANLIYEIECKFENWGKYIN